MLMKKNIYLALVGGLLFLLLGCGREQEVEPKSENPLADKTFDQLTEEDWENIHLSKREFNLLLAGLVEQYNEMEIPLDSVEMFGNEITIIIGNSDGNNNANKEFASLLDGIIRRFYQHSEYNDGNEPTIIIKDQAGITIE